MVIIFSVYAVADRVFGMHHTTDDVFSQIAQPIVQAAMKGFNGTVLRYLPKLHDRISFWIFTFLFIHIDSIFNHF